jgi:hypothetical protein
MNVPNDEYKSGEETVKVKFKNIILSYDKIWNI